MNIFNKAKDFMHNIFRNEDEIQIKNEIIETANNVFEIKKFIEPKIKEESVANKTEKIKPITAREKISIEPKPVPQKIKIERRKLPKNLYLKSGRYGVLKSIKGKNVNFGYYDDFETAEKCLNYCKENNWQINNDEVKRKFGYVPLRGKSSYSHNFPINWENIKPYKNLALDGLKLKSSINGNCINYDILDIISIQKYIGNPDDITTATGLYVQKKYNVNPNTSKKCLKTFKIGGFDEVINEFKNNMQTDLNFELYNDEILINKEHTCLKVKDVYDIVQYRVNTENPDKTLKNLIKMYGQGEYNILPKFITNIWFSYADPRILSIIKNYKNI